VNWLKKHKIISSILAFIVLVAIIQTVNGKSTTPTQPIKSTQSASPISKPAAQSSAAAHTPAYTLAADDLNHAPDNAIVANYQTALDGLKPLCTEKDEYTLASEIWASQQDLIKNGIKDETNLTLIGHIKASIPANSAPVDCRGVMAAYLTLREPHN
jgi:hypothetical protein